MYIYIYIYIYIYKERLHNQFSSLDLSEILKKTRF